MTHMTSKMPEESWHKINTGYRQTFCMSHWKQMGLFNHRESFKHLSKMCGPRSRKKCLILIAGSLKRAKASCWKLSTLCYFSWLLLLWRSETSHFMLHFPILIGWMIKLLNSILSSFFLHFSEFVKPLNWWYIDILNFVFMKHQKYIQYFPWWGFCKTCKF